MSLLVVDSISKAFGGVRAVDDASFSLAPGEMLALIGPNGAGKSTCFNMLNGQLSPDGGRILLAGENIAGRRPAEIWKRGVGRTFQIAASFGSMTAIQNVQTALVSRDGRQFRMWRSGEHYAREEALELLTRVGMEEQAGRRCGILAYGDVKRVELAIALANRPRLLLMDEPTAGMAPGERRALMALTRRLATEAGIGVLFTEHSMDVVFGFADRIVVMARGRIVSEGAPDEVRADPRVREVYFGGGRTVSEHAP